TEIAPSTPGALPARTIPGMERAGARGTSEPVLRLAAPRAGHGPQFDPQRPPPAQPPRDPDAERGRQVPPPQSADRRTETQQHPPPAPPPPPPQRQRGSQPTPGHHQPHSFGQAQTQQAPQPVTPSGHVQNRGGAPQPHAGAQQREDTSQRRA